MKREFLVTFETTVSVSVDVPEGFEPNNCNFVFEEDVLAYSMIVEKARTDILKSPKEHLCSVNVSSIEAIG